MAADQNARAATQRDYKQRMLRVLVHLHNNLDVEAGLDELARIACFSPYHFHRIFLGMTGETVQAHIRRLRLERAATQLKFSRQPVTQIALAAGYQTHESFTRAFRQAFGIAPVRFRSRSARPQPPAAKSSLHYHPDGPPKNFKTNRSGLRAMQVQTKQLAPLRVAFMRHVGPYAEVGRTWDKLCPVLGKDGWLGAGTLFLGICHDDPDVTVAEKLRYDACVTVDGQFRPDGDIGVQTIAGGDYAVATHFGPYEKLGRSYAKLLGQWLPRSGRQLRLLPCLEIYLNTPENTEPADLLTDICIPLE